MLEFKIKEIINMTEKLGRMSTELADMNTRLEKAES